MRGRLGVWRLVEVNPLRFLRTCSFRHIYGLSRYFFASILKFLSVFFMLFAGLKFGCISALMYFSSNF